MTIEFTDKELELLGQALGQMPYAAVAPLIAKINAQIREQIETQQGNPVQGG